MAKGSHTKLLEQIEDLVEAAPDPPSPILGGIEVKHCKSQVKPLVQGKSIARGLRYLEIFATKDNDKGKEAKALIEAVHKYIDSKKEGFIKNAETNPAKTYLELNRLLPFGSDPIFMT